MKRGILLIICSGIVARASTPRIVYLTEKKMAEIHLAVGKTTIISFPAKPSKVVVGTKGLFSVDYIENDVALSPLSSTAKSNLFVYVAGRRFGFGLSTSGKLEDEIVFVRDEAEKTHVKER